MRPDAVIDTCRESHTKILGSLAPLTDEQLASPSLLPGYSRAHVVAHLAAKSRAHILLFEGAALGEVRRLHPEGYDPDAVAATGARRLSSELRSKLARSFERLEQTWDGLADELWDRHGVMTAGPRTMTEIVTHHLRNVEVHHVDLDIGYQVSDWPAHFVEPELAKRLRDLSERTDHADLLGWLLGRTPAPQLGPW